MIPYVTREQIQKLDDLMVEHFHIPVIMMMENAGYRMAEFVRKEFPNKKDILICCGKGNNGGDGIAASRHLLNFGYKPKIFLMTEDIKDIPKMYLNIAKRLNIPIITELEELKKEIYDTEIIYDCLIGYNLSGDVRGKFRDVIKRLNDSKKQIIACDTPSK